MKNSQLLIVIFLSISIFCFGQNSQYFNEKINWKITLPEGFNNEPKVIHQVITKDDNNKNKSKSYSENDYEEVVFKGPNSSSLVVRINKSKSSKMDLEENLKQHNNVIVDSFKSSFPDANVQLNYSKEKIDGIQFYKSVLRMEVEKGKQSSIITYSSEINNYNVTFNFIYIEETEKMKELFMAFSKSKFN